MSVFSQFVGGGQLAPDYPGLGFFGYALDRYYLPEGRMNSYAGTATFLANTLYFVPFFCRQTYAFKAMALRNSGTGDNGDQLRCGVFSNVAGRPAALVNEFTSAAVITCDGTARTMEAAKTVTLNANTPYWLGVVSSGNVDLESFVMESELGTTYPVQSHKLHFGLTALPAGAAYTAFGGFYSQSHTFGALPANASGLAASSGVSGAFPLLVLKG